MKLSKVGLGVTLLLCSQLAGCMGQMGLSGMLTKGNLSAVDNRYGRAGLYVLLAPVYGITAAADLFIFNSIEFWTGKNPITGKSPALVDMPADAVFKINHKLDKDLTTAPVKLSRASISAIDDNTLAMTLSYEDGSEQVMLGRKQGEMVDFYLDQQFIASVSIAEMESYVAARS
ncbi:DUF3332 domain-containing protein [Shewanella indica]|uniref:DUF3332 family protein n=1 Tax=Shewanella chilikensis TaxID=558541 RepID=A0A6G7LWU5_9GAMM|nr:MULTISPECIES: DUF3332 domain-containing protein [Shewanella]MCL1154943.1 DUF3332 domain-containing protein [Shewanella chilikensis]MCL1162377.1 DUF3332 domain-containing protein [Shewanella chilikensis]PYE57480.1 uncharacterized protein DUF3332 [Shewanella chilikensis]QIJ06283.1 DUF3332 family protein [Shewanella chilikensis]GGZ34397.1 membrane protein [Shewanella chilikensis]